MLLKVIVFAVEDKTTVAIDSYELGGVKLPDIPEAITPVRIGDIMQCPPQQ